jgi:hypothetical protein
MNNGVHRVRIAACTVHTLRTWPRSFAPLKHPASRSRAQVPQPISSEWVRGVVAAYPPTPLYEPYGTPYNPTEPLRQLILPFSTFSGQRTAAVHGLMPAPLQIAPYKDNNYGYLFSGAGGGFLQGSAGRGIKGVLDPLGGLVRPPWGMAMQTFLREMRYKLCADPPHTRTLRTTGFLMVIADEKPPGDSFQVRCRHPPPYTRYKNRIAPPYYPVEAPPQ